MFQAPSNSAWNHEFLGCRPSAHTYEIIGGSILFPKPGSDFRQAVLVDSFVGSDLRELVVEMFDETVGPPPLLKQFSGALVYEGLKRTPPGTRILELTEEASTGIITAA